MIIASTLARDFHWMTYRYDFGPASVTTAVGTAIIWAICLGIPWAASAASEP